jgi:selenocysteine-specific elongation factor
VAGERTAVNLAGVEKHDLERGMVLTRPGLLQTSSRLDVRLSLLVSARPLKNGSRVHLHAFSSETIATVALHEDRQLKPGAEAFAKLRLSAPLLLVPGDRFIIRQFSPVLTIGGGVVLDAMPMQKMTVTARLEFLETQSEGAAKLALLSRIVRRGSQGITVAQLVAETGRPEAPIEKLLSELAREGAVTKNVDLLIGRAALSEVAAQLHKLVSEFHKRNSLVSGISKESLREQARLSGDVLNAALELALREKQLAITGELVHLPGRGVVMRDEEAESREVIEQTFATAGLKVPAVKDVLGGLKIDKVRAQKIMTLLLRERVLIKVSDDLLFHQTALAELRKRLATQRLRSPKIDVAGFKDLAGVSRKYAIPLLEYLDRERVTRRVGEQREIL